MRDGAVLAAIRPLHNSVHRGKSALRALSGGPVANGSRRLTSREGTAWGDPRLAMNSRGDAVAVWAGAGDHSIQAVVRSHGGAWQPPVAVFAGEESVSRPDVAVNAQGGAVVVWEQVNSQEDGREKIQASVLPAGGSWQPPETVSGEGENANLPTVATDDDGDAVASWQRWGSPNNERIQAAHMSAGGSWQAPVDLTTPGEISFEPQVAMDPQGDATIVFEHYMGSNTVIESVARPAGGTWQPAVKISEEGETGFEPQIAAGPQGSAVAVWAQSKGSSSIVEGAARPVGSAWQPPVSVSVKGEQALDPQIAVDSEGDALAVWESKFDQGQIGHRETIEGAALPVGGSWQVPAELPGYESSEEPTEGSQSPSVALSVGGGASVWLHRNGTNQVVQGTSDGVTTPLLQSLSIPATGTRAQPVAFSVSPLDPWSQLARTTWSFGDGSSATGTSVFHTYSATGSYPVEVQSENVLGGLTTTSAAITIQPPLIEEAEYSNWVLAGELAPDGATIRLPSGSTFNGRAQLDTDTGSGAVAGDVAVPPFTSTITAHHRRMGLAVSLTQASALAGTLENSESIRGDETLTVPATLRLTISAVSASGRVYPVDCYASAPISLTLIATMTREQLLSKEWSFSGAATIPAIKCKHNIGGVVSGSLLSSRLSGPAEPYSFSVTASG
jgi:hypothetical protein